MAEQEFDNDSDNRTRNLGGAIEDLEQEVLEAARAKREASDEFEDIVPWVIEFRVVGTPDIIRAPISETLQFGRADEQYDIHPEVDLSAYRGQQLGVSRRHALMIARDNRVTIEDMGSANGTYINGQQLQVRRPYRLREGDILQLGNLKLQVHFVVKPLIDEETMHGLGNDVSIPLVGQGQRLLILDDNKDVCRIMRFIGKRSGFEPIVVHTIQEAVSIIDTQQIEAVIVEVMLNDGSGLDIIQYVRQQFGTAVPIIAVGSDAGGFSQGQAQQQGADIFLAKPIPVDGLIEGLRKIASLMAQ